MRTPTVGEMKEKLDFMDMYDELSYILTLEAELKRLRTQITKSAKAKCTIPVVSGSLPLASDNDIEMWAGITSIANSVKQYKWGLIEGAKAMRDGKIKASVGK